MQLYRQFTSIAFIILGFSLAEAMLPGAVAQSLSITASEPIHFDPWAEVPGSFELKGRLVRENGKPIVGARIEAAKGNSTRSNEAGDFKLPLEVAPDDFIEIRHQDYARRSLRAASFFNEDGSRRDIELTRYTEAFFISADGGTYTSGDLTLIVPKGAVKRSITVRATTLPLSQLHDDTGDIQPMRLAGIDFKPHGLVFEKPVTLLVPLVIQAENGPGVPLSWDRDRHRFVKDPTGSVSISDGVATMTLTHFSPHGIGDASKGVSTEDLGRGSDLDGDGEVTTSDALFILMANGGTHEATANYSHTATGSVRQETGSSSTSSTSAGVSGEASGSFKGATFGLSGALSKSKSKEVARKFGKSRKWEVSRSIEISVNVPEYASDCKMVVGRYDFSRGYEWKKVTLNGTEMSVLKTAYNGRSRKAGIFHKFDYKGAEQIVAGRALQGDHTIAARENSDGSFDVYEKVNGYIIAKPRGIASSECALGTGNSLPDEAKKADNAAKGSSDRATALEKGFKFGESWKETKGDQDWGMLGQDVIQSWINMECGNEQSQVWSFSFSNEEDEEENVSEEKGSEKSNSRTVGGFGMSVTASKSSGKSSGKSRGSGRAKGTTISNSIAWKIVNAHGRHWSDHVTAGLFKQTPDGIIPFGFALVRVTERPCGSVPTPIPDPDGSRPQRPVPTGPGSSAPSGPTEPTGQTKPPQTSGGPADRGNTDDVPDDKDVPEGESTQEPGAEPDDRTKADMADAGGSFDTVEEAIKARLAADGLEFADLGGRTNVNPRRTGDIVTVVVVAIDGKVHEVNDRTVKVDETDKSINIYVDPDIKPARMIVKGSKGMVTLRSAFAALNRPGGPVVRIKPSGSHVSSANGVLRESFTTPDGALSMDSAPGDHTITVGGTPVEPVAVRPNEIGVVGTNIIPPQSGSTPVSITNPQGNTLTTDVPSWGYQLGAQPTTQVNVWAPVYFQCTGLPTSDVVLITLIPTGGQEINPNEISITCGQASDLTVIAQYRTSKLGPQIFNAEVRRATDKPG
jgi:hypothetical protein